MATATVEMGEVAVVMGRDGGAGSTGSIDSACRSHSSSWESAWCLYLLHHTPSGPNNGLLVDLAFH